MIDWILRRVTGTKCYRVEAEKLLLPFETDSYGSALEFWNWCIEGFPYGDWIVVYRVNKDGSSQKLLSITW